MKILEFLLNLLIFTIPLGVVLRLLLLPNVFLYFHDVIAGLIFITTSYLFLFKHKKIRQTNLLKLSLVFLLVGFVSLVINSSNYTFTSLIVSFAYLLRYASYLSIIFAFDLLSKKYKDTLKYKLIISGLIFTIFGLIQYIFFNDLKDLLFQKGWDYHLYRLFSTFLDPNFAGSFLVMVLLLISAQMLSFFEKSKNNFYLLIFPWLGVLLAVLLTFSRSAIIMLIVGLVTFLSIKRKFFILGILLAIIVIGFFAFANTSVEGLNPFRTVSTEARIISAKEAIEIFTNNPVFGVGFNAYRYALVEHDLRGEINIMTSHSDSSTDNSYLFVLATTGILGFIIFVAFWINILKLIYNKFEKNSVYPQIVFSIIIALFVNTIFINSIFFTPILAWVFILVGSTVNKKQ